MPSEDPKANEIASESELIVSNETSPNGAVEEANYEAQDVDAHENMIELTLGEALTIEEAARITCCRRSQLIVIAGAVKSGKTTLIASLFHCFQRGPFAGYLFAGSDTLIGLDKRCFLARIASDRTTMDTERTLPNIERKLIHIKLCSIGLRAPIKDILILDLSGEDYREAKDSVEECRKLSLIRAADHFVLLIDGANIIDLEKRQGAKNEATMLLRSCLDAGQLSQESLVDILFTKWDLVEMSEKVSENNKFIKYVQYYIEQRFASRVGRLRFFRVAARPENRKFDLGHGLDGPLLSWVEDTPQDLLPKQYIFKEINTMSEFDKYFKRRLPELFKELK